MEYQIYHLPDGLRVIHAPVKSDAAYCGFVVNAGTRDENRDEYGMAHFVEHCLFKGTVKRNARHILNRMETVGGELNAYTTKEETIIYSVFLEEHIGRAMELLSDLIFNSVFPQKEIEKEIEVVLDEINSYEDSPSELIFDDFENMLFEGHPLGHNILGEPEVLKLFTNEKTTRFFGRNYSSRNMVFFSMGKTDFKKIVRLSEKYLTASHYSNEVLKPSFSLPETERKQARLNKNTNQTHVLIGNRSYGYRHPKKRVLLLLNNILGGPGMNSRLNISLREKSGLVYNVESSLTSFADTGVFSVYFGTDKKNTDRCINLVLKELKRLKTEKLTGNALHSAKRQLSGQIGIAREQRENTALNMGKSLLRFDKYESLPEIYRTIESVTAEDILETADEIFDENRLSSLIYE
ncbi:MAG: insulinase family protein [Candidatus Azobacteroides sp.]|nr:insulinase family protein [Candidatus Azobacteroides sp.]